MNKGMLSVDEALAFLLAGARPVVETEAVSTRAASGRVLAQAQHSTLSVPSLDNTSMDGYAVYSADCASGERWFQCGRIRSVNVRLGAMAFTLILNSPSSRDNLRVNAMMPPLAAQ